MRPPPTMKASSGNDGLLFSNIVLKEYIAL
jgi:hypothetical protein